MFKLIYKSSVSACFELDNNNPYYSPEGYKVYLNGVQAGGERKENVFSLFNLEPDTEYSVKISLFAEEVKFKTCPETALVNVRELGAKGDGVFDDTYYVQMAIDMCPKGGRVLIPAGSYLVRPIVLKSGVTLELKKDAVLLGDTLEEHYPYIKATLDEDDGVNGSWEGEPFDCHQSFVSAYKQKDFAIVGEGTIDGNAQNSTWWQRPRGRKVARPRLMFLNRCQNFVMHGVTCQHSAAWNLHPFFSQDLGFYDVRINNPKISPNTDGLDPESCDRVDIVGCVFSVGDDCVAIKSGKRYMGMKYKTPASNHTLRNDLFRNGHGAIVLGSEMSGGVKNLTVNRCIFENTDRGLRIKTRRGRGKYGVIDGVLFENIKMHGVLTPLVINMYYFCDPDGHTEAVWSRDPNIPVDDGTPYLGNFTFRDIECTDVDHCAAYFDGLVEQPINQITIENVSFSYKEDAVGGHPAMLEFVRDYRKEGIYVDNVNKLILKNVTFDGVEGEKIIKKNCGEIIEC